MVFLVLASLFLGLLPGITVEAKTVYYFYADGKPIGPFDTIKDAEEGLADWAKDHPEQGPGDIYPVEVPDDPQYNLNNPEPTSAPAPQNVTIQVVYQGTDGSFLGTMSGLFTPGIYQTSYFAQGKSFPGYVYSPQNKAQQDLTEPVDHYVAVYYDPVNPQPNNPAVPANPQPTPQPAPPAPAGREPKPFPNRPGSNVPPAPPAPPTPDWEDLPEWDDDYPEDWPEDNRRPASDRNEEKTNQMLIHIFDYDNNESLGPDIVLSDLPTGTEVDPATIAPDINGYMPDFIRTADKFVQKPGLYEDAIYYTPNPFGYEWFEDEDDLPQPPDVKEGDMHCPGDPMCPDHPCDSSDPQDPKSIPDPPIGDCPCKNGGTVCEQLGHVICTLFPANEIKQPQGGRMPIPAPLAGKKPLDQKFLSQQRWDESYDAIIYGFDMAGAVAALTIAEEGGRVVLLDKAPLKEIGSYTPYTEQEFLYAKDAKKFASFMDAWNQGYDHLDQDLVKAFSDASQYLPAWFTAHGAEKLYRFPHVMYEEFPGSEGAGAFRLSEKSSFDQAAWKLILKAMKPYVKKNIFLLSEATVTDLIQDPQSGTVVGVKAHLAKKNKDVSFQAKSGVILAGGGFENNESMIENFLQMPAARAKYSKHNTGDTIPLAMQAGADLWHMDNVLGYELHLAGVDKQYQFRNPLQGIKNYQLGGRPCFVVGPNGRRFSDEGALVRQGHIYRTGEWRAQEIPSQAWAIVDEKGLTQAPLAQGWSQDNMAEVAAGKILKADSLEALAQAIKLDPADLEDQFADYQSFCQNGWDPQFGRRPQNLLSLEENGPYYAIPLTPVLEATLGGPRRNTACQVLDTKGEIIPRLYSAGSLGSFFPNLFPQGADLSEAVITGQIAGVNALKNK